MTSRRHFGNVRKLPSGRYQASYWHEGARHVAPDTFTAKADALAYLANTETDLHRGAWIDPHRADTTVGSLAAQWKVANPAKRSSSLARDETILRLHVLPVLEERRIGAVTPRDIQGLVSSWVAEGKAPKTVRRQYDVVRAIFAYAVAGDVLVRTPCRNVKLPAVAKRDRHQLTPDDVARLAKAVGPEYGAMVYLGAILGLRWGEVAGLRVGRLDQLRGTLAVEEQIVRGEKGRPGVGPPKSAAGRRTLTMPKALVDVLAEHLRRRGLTAADSTGYVFVGPDGGPLDYTNWRRRVWIPATQKAGLADVPFKPVRVDADPEKPRVPDIDFHDLRRAAATALVAGGVDVKTAQDRLGHSDSRLTLDLYAQVTTEADRAAAEVMGERFLPSFAHVARTARTRRGTRQDKSGA